MNKKIIIAAFLVLIISAAAGCARQPKKAELKKVTIAFQEWVGYGLLYLAQDKGFFQEEGIELVFIDEQLDSARRDAFKAGMLDCEAGTIDLLVSKRAQDTPIVAVMEIDISFGSDGIVAVEEIKSIEDLLGKKVAFARDDVGETFISYLFHKHGISLKDVTIISTLPEKASRAFLDGEADAVVTWEPWLSRAAQRPGAHVLVTSRDEPGIIIDTLNVREDIVNNDPELVAKLIRGWFRALGYYRKHPHESSGLIAEYYNMRPEHYRKAVTGLKWLDCEEQVEEGEEGWLDAFNHVSEIKYVNKRILKKPDASKAINRELLKRVYENIK